MFSSKSWFTLVEILIVMSMVGILASFMFPSLTPYIARGRDSSRVADTKTIQTYLKTYEIDTWKYIDHTNWCVPYTTLQNAGYTTTLPKSPSGDLYNEWCWPNGQYAYGTSTGLLIGHGVSLLMSHMERESGWNYSGSTNGMTGDITPIGYLLMNTTEKWSGPWYLLIDSWDTSWSGSSSSSGSSGSWAPLPDIDGGWSAWQPTLTGSCSTTCWPGTAFLVQFRSCTNPAPSGSWANCTGSPTQNVWSVACNLGTCNTNGACDNSTQFSCTSGTPVSNLDNYTGPSCGGISTWWCNGSGTGTSTSPTACSRANPVCAPVNCVGSWWSCSNGSQTYTITTPVANWWVACGTINGATQSCGSPTGLSLSHTPWTKSFTFSWTAGIESGLSCKLQYLRNGSIWTDISATVYNCDNTISNQSVILPGDGWNNPWISLQVRAVRTSNSTSVWVFPQSLTCSTMASSASSTPNIDENCDGIWDNYNGGQSYVAPVAEQAGTYATATLTELYTSLNFTPDFWTLDNGYYRPHFSPDTLTSSTIGTLPTWPSTINISPSLAATFVNVVQIRSVEPSQVAYAFCKSDVRIGEPWFYPDCDYSVIYAIVPGADYIAPTLWQPYIAPFWY